MSLRTYSSRGLLVGAALAALLLPGATHAGIATFVGSHMGHHATDLAPTRAGGFVVSDGQSMSRLDENHFAELTISNFSPGLTSDPFAYLESAVELPDGRLVGFDQGNPYGTPSAPPRFVFWNPDGSFLAHLPINTGIANQSNLELTAGGELLLASQSSGRTTIRRFNSAGAELGSWTVATTGYSIASQDGVLYLAGDARGKIFKFDPSGALLGTLSTGLPPSVVAIDVDEHGLIYAVLGANNGTASMLAILSPAGKVLEYVERVGPDSFSAPSDILVQDGSLYVADGPWYTGAIHEFTLDLAVPATPTSWGRMKALYR